MCACACMCLYIWMHALMSSCHGVNVEITGQHSGVNSPSTVRDPVVSLGNKCLYLLYSLTGPNLGLK